MTALLVDTSVWSLALRRDTVADVAQVQALRRRWKATTRLS